MADAISAQVRAAMPSDGLTGSYWTSLSYFNIYRIAIAVLFLSFGKKFGAALDFGSENPRLFLVVAIAYLALGLVFQALIRVRGSFNAHLSAHVITDIAAITLLAHASGGSASNLTLMLLVSLAGAALVSQGRMILFYAAVATIAVLLEHLLRVLLADADPGTFLQPALVSIAFFATAIITNFLAKRVIANEEIARERGVRLARQLHVNALIIEDARDGIVVVDPEGCIQLFNPQAEALLGDMAHGMTLAECAEPLDMALRRWRDGRGAGRAQIEFPDTGKRVRARFVDIGAPTAAGSVVYLEDEAALEERARQHKLAALGRLTANIAHEIRNPLSAIVHAADLMEEENRAPQRARLTRIMRDNAARLDRMVRDVLELNRRDRAQPERFSLDAFINVFLVELVEQGEVAEDGVRYDGSAGVEIDFDRVHLHQVLWNLARNAWRHSSQQSGSVVFRVVRTPDQLELHVIDDGGGVPKSLLPQLFEPFFTTYSSGTGLGLYIARELCAANGARLEYRQRESGADFCIVWPQKPQ